MTKNDFVTIVAVVFIVGVVAVWGYSKIEEQATFAERCVAAGGVPVGGMLQLECFDKSVRIING